MKKENVLMTVIVVLVVVVIGLAGYVGQTKSSVSGTPDNNKVGASDSIQYRPIASTDFKIGPKNPKITILEYSDTECPFCIQFHKTLKTILESYPDIAWVYRFSPIPQLHAHAPAEAAAAYCVGKLNGNDAFWTYLNRIFSTTPGNDKLDQTKLDQYAAEIGVKTNDFAACRADSATSDYIKADQADALRAGLQGTPYSLVLNSQGEVINTIPGYLPFESLKPQLDKWLAQAK